MRRRAFTAGAMALAATPFAAQAQTPRAFKLAVAAIGLPLADLAATGSPEYVAFFDELRRLGYVEGRTLDVTRWSTLGMPEAEFEQMARSVVASSPDAIFVQGARLSLSFKAATATIPVVFYGATPLEFGIVKSLARPEGNITGMASDAGPEVYGKRMQLLHDTKTGITNIAFLATPQIWDSAPGDAVRQGAAQLALRIVPVLVDPVSAGAIADALASISGRRDLGLIVSSSRDFVPHARSICDIAARYGWPAIAQQKEYPD